MSDIAGDERIRGSQAGLVSGRERPRDADPAFISGTSSEFLGQKPLPRSVRSRPVIFILGPIGVGKSAVARRLLGEAALHMDGRELGLRVACAIRSRGWDTEIQDCEGLILDAPYFISRRPGYRKSIGRLLRQRVIQGHRTILLESQDMASMQDLMDAVDLEQRATVSLRFPVGRGRRRYAQQVCDQLGVSTSYARQMTHLEPWSYGAVREALQQLSEQ